MIVKKLSKKKEYPVFEALLRQEFGQFVSEYKFHPTRKFRFDYAYPDQKIAIEIEGLTRPGQKSRHTENQGYKNDCTKYNEAAVLGWRVLRITQDMTLKASTFEMFRKILLIR
jgi:very-short-patch-repair endonuclease